MDTVSRSLKTSDDKECLARLTAAFTQEKEELVAASLGTDVQDFWSAATMLCGYLTVGDLTDQLDYAVGAVEFFESSNNGDEECTAAQKTLCSTV